MIITDKDGKQLDDIRFAIGFQQCDGVDTDENYILDSITIAQAIKEYIDKNFNNGSVVYKEEK